MYNTNNYGFNQYGGYMPQRPTQQPIQQPMQPTVPTQMSLPLTNTINGKVVESIDIVRNLEIPLDGSTSYFPTASGDAIVTKQLTMDGTSKIVIYKPVNEKEEIKTKYITAEELSKEINKIDLSDIDDLKEEIKEIKKVLKELKKKGD